jgi:hypothetical protein
MSTQPDPEYVVALIAAKDCLRVVINRLEAALERPLQPRRPCQGTPRQRQLQEILGPGGEPNA